MCAGQRLSLRLSARAGLPFRTRTVELIRRHLRQVGVEVVISFSAFATFGQILESGAFDLAEFTWFNFDRIGGEVYGCGGAFNYTGYCQRLVTADLNQADRILDAEQRARVLNRADRRLAKDVPVIPLYQPPGLIAFRATIRNVVARVWRRAHERGELVARPLALVAAVAVSLLAVSGAGGAGAQTPKRGGTVVIAQAPATRARLSQRPLVGFVHRTIVSFWVWFSAEPSMSLRTRRSARSSSLATSISRRSPFTLLYHIRPQARWSDRRSCHRVGLQSSRHQAIRKHRPNFGYGPWSKVRSVRADRREDVQGRSARARSRLALSLPGRPAESRACRQGPRESLEGYGSTTRGRDGGSGAAPSCSSDWERGQGN